ncbi:hypothetical protein CHS0354_007214 [Potamilus streckersoni]|uniref:Peptidase M12B domain-containing protein n=1 Tax=Potamilus streckersoni TaxID=2493646 RepID=A0AAE0SMN6_9BIVA|nr:hypothetical protein CHS0354_007214 [Potamilus streckersoni]
MFPYKNATVTIVNGTKYVDASAYLDDLSDWDKTIGASIVPAFDHAMLFTSQMPPDIRDRIILFTLTSEIGLYGLQTGSSPVSGVCELGERISVIMERHYVVTVQTAAHELGHNLGASHDGEGDATGCKAEDYFIMSAHSPHLCKNSTYFRNMWIFSNCSVDSFKRTLKTRDCVKRKGSVYDKYEYKAFMNKQAGDVFTPQEQCSLVYGPGSKYYGVCKSSVPL